MRHHILDKHQILGWDFDGTLSNEVHQAPNSDFFLAYITAHPEKRHHIITFRDREWANEIWTSFCEIGLDIKLIRSIESCPDIIHDCFQINKKYGVRPDYYTNTRDLTNEQFIENAGLFTKWKAERAKQIGCTILVDDIEDWVLDGCEFHGVEFLHAHAPCP